MDDKRALLIGIDDYKSKKYAKLKGCVKAAEKLAQALELNADKEQTKNFHVEIFSDCKSSKIAQSEIAKSKIESLFNSDGHKTMALLYFAGHGTTEVNGGQIVFKDGSMLAMETILAIVAQSQILNKIILFDCCVSGQMGSDPFAPTTSKLPDGVTIMTACTDKHNAGENTNGGIFTQLLVNALNGGAADFLGRITIGGIYAYIDKLLGASNQRPVLKTNVRSFALMKQVAPQVSIKDLRKIVKIFERPEQMYDLDSSYEPTNNPNHPDRPSNYHEPYADKKHTEIFAVLQSMVKIGLVVPYHDDPKKQHMYFAAMDGKYCKLTEQGKLCWRLVKEKII